MWSTAAFTLSTSIDEYDDFDIDQDAGGIESALETAMNAKSQFMKLILSTQMPNVKRIEHETKTYWNSVVTTALPHLSSAQADRFLEIFIRRWAIIKEIHSYFAQNHDGTISSADFKLFCGQIRLFEMNDISTISIKTFTRVCSLTDQSSLNLSAFLVSLVILAQLRHNDTYESKSNIHDASSALEEILYHNIIPFAEKIKAKSILKDVFASREFLYKLRDHHEALYLVYENTAQKSHALPTSINIEHMSELLFKAKLLNDNDAMRTQELFEEVKSGTQPSVIHIVMLLTDASFIRLDLFA
jgi:hypothetical protein